MDIYKERDNMLSTERFIEQNERVGNSQASYKETHIKLHPIRVGDTVWAIGKGPRTVTSISTTDYGEIHAVSLAEESKTFRRSNILPYQIEMRNRRAEFVQKIDFRFVLKHGTKLMAVPPLLTIFLTDILLMVGIHQVDLSLGNEIGLYLLFSVIAASSAYFMYLVIDSFIWHLKYAKGTYNPPQKTYAEIRQQIFGDELPTFVTTDDEEEDEEDNRVEF